MNLLNGVIDERLAFSALNDELGLAILQGTCGAEDVLNEAENTVVLNDLGCSDLETLMLVF